MRTRPLAISNDLVALAATIAEALSFAPNGAGAAARPIAARPSAEPGWRERLDRWIWRQQQRELEAQLAKATDLSDLEKRQHAIERGVGACYY